MMQHNYECGNHLTHSRQDVMLAAKVSANHSKVDICAKRCIHYILIRHLSHQEEERMGMVIYKPTAERSLSHTSGKNKCFLRASPTSVIVVTKTGNINQTMMFF